MPSGFSVDGSLLFKPKKSLARHSRKVIPDHPEYSGLFSKSCGKIGHAFPNLGRSKRVTGGSSLHLYFCYFRRHNQLSLVKKMYFNTEAIRNIWWICFLTIFDWNQHCQPLKKAVENALQKKKHFEFDNGNISSKKDKPASVLSVLGSRDCLCAELVCLNLF